MSHLTNQNIIVRNSSQDMFFKLLFVNYLINLYIIVLKFNFIATL